MNENEYYEEEGRYYANPQLGLDETSQFLESFEAARQRENDRIAQETHALGTDVPSSMGGLSGSGGVWRQRYQNPQVSKMITDLDAEMQAQALSTAMSNELAKWQNRYNQAKRNYNKRKNTPTAPATPAGDVAVEGYEPVGETSDWNVNRSGVPGTMQLIVDGEVQLYNQDGTPYVDPNAKKETSIEEMAAKNRLRAPESWSNYNGIWSLFGN